MVPDAPLVALPPQPDGVPWPDEAWPIGDPPAAVRELVDEAFEDAEKYATTFAVVVVQGGRLLAERYGGRLPSFTGPGEEVHADTPLLSWSMAKSVLHAAIGILVGEGRLCLDEPAPVPVWHEQPGDQRAAITLDHLLQMRDGLDWAEDYVDAEVSDVIEMLFGRGQHDVAAYAEARPPAHPPGEVFNYSSGASNVIAGILRRTVGPGEATERFLFERLLHPIGMRSADPRFDSAGTFIASSFFHATARDYARFGLLYLRDGVWDGRRILPEGWVDHGRRARSEDPEDGDLYGAHWWVDRWDLERGTFRASGYEGQTITICPALDAVVVRLGRTPKELADAHLPDWRRRMLDALS